MMSFDDNNLPPGCGWRRLQHGMLRCRRILPRKPPASAACSTPSHGLKKHRQVSFLETSAAVLKSIADPDSAKQVPEPITDHNWRRGTAPPELRKAAASGPGNLVRASSSNVMVPGSLGNLMRAAGKDSSGSGAQSVLDDLPKTAEERRASGAGAKKNGSVGAGTNSVMGNIVKRRVEQRSSAPPVLCRALSARVDPEALKEMGNKEYRKGRFAEAVAFYDRAIAMDQKKASFWSNKAAALTGLGRLLDAVEQCREAVRIEPSYFRAHHRLANLYLRLGDTVKAMHHYQLSGGESSSKDFARIRSLRSHLNNFGEARKRKDWQTVLGETQSAISAGADSAPQVFAAQAEALLKLQRHQEAEQVLTSLPAFDDDPSADFFGAPTNAYVLTVQAQVDMACGRFESAVSVAERAVQLDPTNKEVTAVARRTRAVTMGRTKGNDLFKSSKFREASAAYEEGLEHDPFNSVLLCNRAACWSKLERWEEALADCDAALNVRPSYHKARLRRADCNAKLGKWEAAIRDYEVLMEEDPGDEEASRALWDARFQLMKERRS